MTRETKIGLLVGLAFIIVIGILLSDYNRNEIQSAALPLVADNVRSSTATLHNGSNQIEVVPPPAPVVPSRTVPTRDDLHRETVIDITPGPGSLPARPDADRRAVLPAPPVVAENTTFTPSEEIRPTPPTLTPDSHNASGIPDTIAVDPRQPAVVPQPPQAVPTVNGARQYVAASGDTLNKLAGRFLGGNTKANREAILAINPSLKANPNNLIVGKTYMIPGPRTAVASVAANTGAPSRSAVASPAPALGEGPHYFYTVKENDNLWKIASEQLGDGSAWAAIKELNRDVLKGRDDVRPNMRLRLPAKPVASIN